MWEQILSMLQGLYPSLVGLRNFLNFVQHRQQIIATFSKDQKRLVELVKRRTLKLKESNKIGSEFYEMSIFATEYIETLLDDVERYDFEEDIISLGKELEIKHTQINDPYLRQVSKNLGGDMAKIERL